MKKWMKGLMGLAAAGGAIAGLIYYFKKQNSCEEDEFEDEFEDDDFDLDSDLKLKKLLPAKIPPIKRTRILPLQILPTILKKTRPYGWQTSSAGTRGKRKYPVSLYKKQRDQRDYKPQLLLGHKK